MKLYIILIIVFVSNFNGVFGQYQFPNNAVAELKSHTNKYVSLIKSNEYLHINMEIYNRYETSQTAIRRTEFHKVNDLIIVSGEDFEYFIDDSLMFFSDYTNKKVFITNVDQEGKVSNNFINSLVLSFDSILTYCASVTYTENVQEIFQISIAPENLYVFDNLEFQKVYYSPERVLPDSIIKSFYAETRYSEVTNFTSFTTEKSSKYPFKSAWFYFYDAQNKPLTKYKDFSFSIL